jgi:hypothetical protein
MAENGRKIVGVSLSPEAYAKLRLLGDQLGLTDAGAAKHLIMMSLQSLMGQLNQLQQGNVMERMVDLMKDELGTLEEIQSDVLNAVGRKKREEIQAQVINATARRKTGGGASNTATTDSKCPLPFQSKGAKRQ